MSGRHVRDKTGYVPLVELRERDEERERERERERGER